MKLVCPNGHTRAFRFVGAMSDLVYRPLVVDGEGRAISPRNPRDGITELYECLDCGGTFDASMLEEGGEVRC